eukprot:3700657-Amphidinium_carterae.1
MLYKKGTPRRAKENRTQSQRLGTTGMMLLPSIEILKLLQASSWGQMMMPRSRALRLNAIEVG